VLNSNFLAEEIPKLIDRTRPFRLHAAFQNVRFSAESRPFDSGHGMAEMSPSWPLAPMQRRDERATVVRGGIRAVE